MENNWRASLGEGFPDWACGGMGSIGGSRPQEGVPWKVPLKWSSGGCPMDGAPVGVTRGVPKGDPL
jgi:hypothetical protein